MVIVGSNGIDKIILMLKKSETKNKQKIEKNLQAYVFVSLTTQMI